MKRWLSAALILVLAEACLWATIVTATVHIEIADLGNNPVSAQGSHKVKAMNVDQQRFNEVLEIRGALFRENSCNGPGTCCNNRVDFCNSSKILTTDGQEETCSNSGGGTCDHSWDGTSDGKIDIVSIIVDKATAVCEQGDCDPSCEECT